VSYFPLVAAQDRHVEVAGDGPVVRDRAPLEERRVFIGAISRNLSVPDANNHVITRRPAAR